MNENRARYLLVVFGLLFVTLIGFMTYIEIFDSEKLNETVYNPRNIERNKTIIRGSIYDRNGECLAWSEMVTTDQTDENGDPIKKAVRHYDYNDMYTGIVGYVTPDYKSRTFIEDVYNQKLLETNVVSKINDHFSGREKTGKSLTLTLDHKIQKAAYDALGNYKGAVVALNPKTGEIYALVSKPSQDANNINFTNDKDDKTLFSHPIQTPYPPGSTYKIITAAAILEAGLENEIVHDTTGWFIIESADGNPDNNYKCPNYIGNKRTPTAYGDTDLKYGFRVSSNVYFNQMGVVLGQEKVQSIAKKFLVGTDLNNSFDFELNITQSKFHNGQMTDAQIAMTSIGQFETEMTPLHLALVAATIANDGVMPDPYVVSKVGSDNVAPNPSGKPIINSSTASAIKDMMLDVCKNGTGTAASINGKDVCGKTGTAENATGKGDHALFVGFAPYDNPQIAVCVVVENGGSGGSVAAPISKKVMEAYFNN